MKIYQSLFILKNTYDSINYLSEIMVEHNLTFLNPGTPDERKLFHFMSLFKHTILETCTFMEEYEKFFGIETEPEYRDRVRFVKRAAKPVMKKIKAWSDLQTIRNELIAHPWRGKGNSFSYHRIFTYKAPRTFFELQTLRYCLLMIIGLLDAEFGTEFEDIPSYMESIKPTPVPPITNSDIIQELKDIIGEVNSICSTEKKNYYLVSEKIIGK